MASIRSVVSVPPSVVSLPGVAAGALGAALSRVEARVVVELLRGDGIGVEVAGVSGSVARAAYLAATRLLEEMGEEARLRIRVEASSPGISPVASVAAGVTAALIELLGVELPLMDLARILNSVVADVAGLPMPPLVAAALYGGITAGSENPPLYTRLPHTPPWRLYVVEAPAPEREEVMVTLDRLRQIASGLATLIGYGSREGWEKRLQGFLAQASPWDIVAPEIVEKARKAALEEGALGAGVDPYLGHLVVVAEEPGPARRAARIVAAGLGHEPFVIEAGIAQGGALAESTSLEETLQA